MIQQVDMDMDMPPHSFRPMAACENEYSFVLIGSLELLWLFIVCVCCITTEFLVHVPSVLDINLNVI